MQYLSDLVLEEGQSFLHPLYVCFTLECSFDLLDFQLELLQTLLVSAGAYIVAYPILQVTFQLMNVFLVYHCFLRIIGYAGIFLFDAVRSFDQR